MFWTMLVICSGLTCLYALDFAWITMATDTSSMDPDSRRNCVTCKTRMSSLLHDSHTVCCTSCGYDCSLGKRCSKCEAWSEDVMMKYVKYGIGLLRAKSVKRRRLPPQTKLHFHSLGTRILVFPPQLRLAFWRLGSLSSLAPS